MTTSTTAAPTIDHEPTDPAARLRTGRLEWARDTRATRRPWLPIGAHRAVGLDWPDLVRMFPDAEVVEPAPVSEVGRTIPARRTDPGTSHKATPTPVRARTQRAKLLESFGLPSSVEGITDEEAMEKAVGVSPVSEYAKRCSELRDAGLIAVVVDESGATVVRKGNTGIDRIVSRITDEGHRVLAAL